MRDDRDARRSEDDPVIRKAVFPVAGLGTRMLPATKAIPKEMLPVVDKPIIQYAFEEARAAGIEHFIFVTGRGKSVIEDHFDHAYELDDALVKKDKHAELEAVSAWVPAAGRAQLHPPAGAAGARPCRLVRARAGRQRAVRRGPGRRPRGRATSPACARWSRRTPRPAATSSRSRRSRRSTPTAMACSTRPTTTAGWSRSGAWSRSRIRPGAPSRLAVIGRYILLPEVFEHLALQQTGAGGEIQLTDAHGADDRPPSRSTACASRGGASTAARGSAIWKRPSPARWSARICARACVTILERYR